MNAITTHIDNKKRTIHPAQATFMSSNRLTNTDNTLAETVGDTPVVYTSKCMLSTNFSSVLQKQLH